MLSIYFKLENVYVYFDPVIVIINLVDTILIFNV
jgi:hypothetical protein